MPPGERLVQKISSTRAFARCAPHVIPALDRAVHRLTRGKVLLSAQLLPGVILSATGARTLTDQCIMWSTSWEVSVPGRLALGHHIV